MDSWTLQGDSYSFLRSAPPALSLCHRDGTPNHVEIFDIISVPNQRTAISETTCLCDIFGDERESPSLPVSSIEGPFVPFQREVDGIVASPVADDLNDSSGSYHSAQGFSEGEEGFEDSRERLCSPPLLGELSQRTQPQDTRHPGNTTDSNTDIESKKRSPSSNNTSLTEERTESTERTPSPGYNSRYTLSIEGRASFSPPVGEETFSPVPPNPGRESELKTKPLPFRNNSPSYQALSPSPFSDNCLTPDPPQKEDVLSEPRSTCFLHHSSPSPEPTSKDVFQHFPQSNFEAGVIVPSPVSSDTDRSHWSRGGLTSPELENRHHPTDSQQSSPLPELTRRVSVPDLFSRGSTPDTDIYASKPELISHVSAAEREYTPESQETRLSPQTIIAASAPCTPPSPGIAIEPSQVFANTRDSSQLGPTTPSNVLLRLDSPFSPGTRTPTLLSSPVMSHSLSPSPAGLSNCSSIDHRYMSPSPGIIITASSPEVRRKAESSEDETSACVVIESNFASASPRSSASSPHITAISCSVVQPEKGETSPFAELSRLSSPDPDITVASSEINHTSGSLTGPTETAGDYLHDMFFRDSVEHSEIVYSPIYKTPSPKPINRTPLFGTKSHTIAADKCLTPSPHHRSKTPSPVSESAEQRPDQPNVSTQGDPECCPLNTSECEWDSSSVDFTDSQYPTHLAEEKVSPSIVSDRGESSGTEIRNKSSPLHASPLSAVENVENSQNRQRQEIEVIPQEVTLQDNLQKENINFSCPSELKPISFDQASEDSHSVSPHWVAPTAPVVSLGTPQPMDTSCSPTFENNSLFKRSFTPEHTQGQGSSSDRITEEMAYRQRRRRTPSPPLTRFTPVHIIAPQRPQRHWQNSSRSPSQVVASSPSNLKRAVTNRESPDVATADNNSPAYWGRLGTQLEIDREMQMEEAREVGRERLMERRMERHREGEEQLPEKGKGWQEKASYREKQAELSFSSRNRKGSLTGSGAHTSRQTSQGLPAVHSYSESSRSSRQQRQQQKVIFASQSDSWASGPERRLQPPASHNKSRAAGGAAVNKLSQSSSSSMGSELDEADNELNWFRDPALSTLSSPEVDYLDMYNSSHCSSTNVSQPSTQESPAGVSATLHAYADFRHSGPNNDEDCFQQPSTLYTGGLDPSRRLELGSFECIDVAVEREDHKRSRRGVPKREIQLKRKGSDESSHAVLRPVRAAENFKREVFMRQHSTPVAIPKCFSADCTRGNNQQQEQKSNLQKSASLDEVCTRTKTATCLINNVLSKKMHSVDPKPQEQSGEKSPGFEENNLKRENVAEPVRDPLKRDGPTLSSGLQSDCSFMSERLFLRGEPPGSSKSIDFSQTDNEEVETGSFNTDIGSEIKAPFDSKQSETRGQQVGDAKPGDVGKNEITGGNVRPPSEPEGGTGEAGATDRDEECEKPETNEAALQSDRGTPTSKGISLQDKDKKKTSLNVCLTPEADNKQEAFSQEDSHRDKDGRQENNVEDKTEKEGKRNNHKAPIHKVRDVRRLVKNTYNLSFKAIHAAQTSVATDDMIGKFNGDTRQEMTKEIGQKIKSEEFTEIRQEIRKSKEEIEIPEKKIKPKEETELLTTSPPGNATMSRPQPMHIEYKAVCWKEDKNKLLCSSPQDCDANIQEEDRSVEVGKEGRTPMPGSLPKQPSKEREVSTAVVVIRDASGKTQASAQKRTPTPPPASVASPSPGTAVPGSSGHSVSMLLKEKGYQADIGAVVGDSLHEAGRKKVPCKHVNSLKIPLQNAIPSDVGHLQSQKERKVSAAFNATGPPAVSDSKNTPAKIGDDDDVGNKPPGKDATKQKSTPLLRNALEQTRLPTTQKEYGDFEAVKRLDPTFPPRSPAPRRFRSQPIEVKSVSKEIQKPEMPVGFSGSRPQTIEVKSIAKKSQKPVVPPKPSCKFKPATELESELSEAQGPAHRNPPVKPQNEDRPQTIVVSSPTIYRKISNEVISASNTARKLSVSAIASLKPPPSKAVEPLASRLDDHATATSTAEGIHGSAHKQTPGASQQTAGNLQRPTVFASVSSTGPRLDSEPVTRQVPEPVPAEATHQPSQPVAELDNQAECSPMVRPRQPLPASLGTTNQPAASGTQLPEYTHRPYRQAISGEHGGLSDHLHFYASDDPPSYDERESFSPLLLPELPSRRLNRYQPSSHPPPCSCAVGSSLYSGPASSHRHRSPHNLTPPAPPHSPGQTPLAQPLLHQARCDPQQTTYQAVSPKSSLTAPSQPPALYPPAHQPPPCPPHPSLIQTCPIDRPLQPFQQNESRQPSVRRSPQQQPPAVAAAPYCSTGQSHSPGLPHVDPQCMCGPSYGSEYGGDTSSLYSESTYGQTPRRVLLDPETGKYFYVEVPVQPLRKMLFDPETGQYVEVLIPQQAMSHSGLYPPPAAPYLPLHNPNMYAPAQQYMPYAAPPLAHPQAQSQPPRYPEASAAAPLQQSGPGVTYRNPTGLPPKPELQTHPPQSYLESMYYVPTGMSASPNPTPQDYYKHPPNLPPTRRERS